MVMEKYFVKSVGTLPLISMKKMVFLSDFHAYCKQDPLFNSPPNTDSDCNT